MRSAAAPGAVSTPGSYVSVAPARILDTRATGAVPPQSTILVPITRVAGIPANASAVVFNLTVTDPRASGYIDAYPVGAHQETSSINFAVDETRAHTVVVRPGKDGEIGLYNATIGSVQLIVDVAGYYTAGAPAAGGEFGAVQPARLFDTRTGGGVTQGARKHGSVLRVRVTGREGIPASGVGAVVLNLTATASTAGGYLQLRVPHSGTTSAAKVSSVNFQPRQTASNLVVAPVAADGTVSIVAMPTTGTVQIVADVAGWFKAGSPTQVGQFGVIAAHRILDTRLPNQSVSALPPGATVSVRVTGEGGVPSTGVTAVVLNVTVPSPRSRGYLTAYPSGTRRPLASSVNFAGFTIANEAIVGVGADGKVSFYNGSSTTQNLVLDVGGFVGPASR